MAVDFDLNVLTEQIRLATLDLAGRQTDPALLAARLFDGLDDAGIPRPPATEWAKVTNGFDAEAWNRMAILVRLFRDTPLKDGIATSIAAKSALETFGGFCSGLSQLLTIELLQKSPFRVEELARKWVHALDGTIAGETPAESRQRMERLDFGGVLKNLQAADADRAARVKKLQEIEAKRLKEQQEAYERSGRE